MSAANSAGLGDGWLLRNRATTALITGGTQGLGLAVAKRLGQGKARGTVISGRNVERGEDAACCRTGRLPVKPGVRCYDWGPWWTMIRISREPIPNKKVQKLSF